MTGHPSLFDDPDDDEPRPPTSDPDVVKPGLTGRGHPDTSREAGYRGQVGFATERARVLLAVADAGYDGLTAAEVAEVTGGTRSQSAARMLELREADWIMRRYDEQGQLVKRQTTPGGYRGAVHVLIPVAESDLADWKARRARWKAEGGRDDVL